MFLEGVSFLEVKATSPYPINVVTISQGTVNVVLLNMVLVCHHASNANKSSSSGMCEAWSAQSSTQTL